MQKSITIILDFKYLKYICNDIDRDFFGPIIRLIISIRDLFPLNLSLGIKFTDTYVRVV